MRERKKARQQPRNLAKTDRWDSIWLYQATEKRVMNPARFRPTVFTLTLCLSWLTFCPPCISAENGRIKSAPEFPDEVKALSNVVKASLVVPSAIDLAKQGFGRMRKKHEALRNVKKGDWEFFLTIAGVTIALDRLNITNIREKEKARLRQIIDQDLKKYDKQGPDAVEDCKAFLGRTLTAEFVASNQNALPDALGMWVGWNLYGHAPKYGPETEPLRAIGMAAVTTFVELWKKPNSAAKKD